MFFYFHGAFDHNFDNVNQLSKLFCHCILYYDTHHTSKMLPNLIMSEVCRPITLAKLSNDNTVNDNILIIFNYIISWSSLMNLCSCLLELKSAKAKIIIFEAGKRWSRKAFHKGVQMPAWLPGGICAAILASKIGLLRWRNFITSPSKAVLLSYEIQSPFSCPGYFWLYCRFIVCTTTIGFNALLLCSFILCLC